jgi:hypothetical protein
MLGAHMRPRGTWLWRERLSRILRGCCAAVVPVVHPSGGVRTDSSPPGEAKAPQTRILLNKVGEDRPLSIVLRATFDLRDCERACSESGSARNLLSKLQSWKSYSFT